MSMNVADSTDLIHGGGGNLANFWRSRTDFEKKLLVALAVMSLVIVAMTVAVIVLAVENGKNNPMVAAGKPTGQLTHIKSTRAGAKEVSMAVPEEALNSIGETAPPSRIPSAPSRYKDTSESQTTLQSKDTASQQEALLSPSDSNEENQDDYVTDKHSSSNQSNTTERMLMSL